MKLTKLSLVAVMALGTSVFAIDNVKVNGEAKFWYQTFETKGTATAVTTNNKDYFDHDTNSMANIKLSVGATADLLQSVSAGVKATALTTLGLENNLVGDVSSTKFDGLGNSVGTDKLNDQGWVEELWLAYTAGKTTAKVGRQRLDTPLAFSENWNVVDNTFEAAVLLNNDIPDTTLVGAWVGKHNGVGLLQTSPTVQIGRNTTVAYNGEFSTFATDGAYAAGALNKSIPSTTLQAWYYNVTDIGDAYWLQADTKLFNRLSIGIQYGALNPDSALASLNTASVDAQGDTDMFAIKGGLDIASFNLYAAFSSVSDGAIGFANFATGDKTMMYTGLASVYFDGEIVSAPDTDAFKVGVSTKIIPGVTLAASYGEADTGNNGGKRGVINGLSVQNNDYTAWDIVANTKTGPVDWTAIFTQFERENTTTNVTTIDNSLFRVIASLKF